MSSVTLNSSKDTFIVSNGKQLNAMPTCHVELRIFEMFHELVAYDKLNISLIREIDGYSQSTIEQFRVYESFTKKYLSILDDAMKKDKSTDLAETYERVLHDYSKLPASTYYHHKTPESFQESVDFCIEAGNKVKVFWDNSKQAQFTTGTIKRSGGVKKTPLLFTEENPEGIELDSSSILTIFDDATCESLYKHKI